MYRNILPLALLIAFTTALHGMYPAPCCVTDPVYTCNTQTEADYPTYNQCQPLLILTAQAEILLDALEDARINVLEHPDHGKLFGTLQKLINLMQQRDGFTGKPLKPGAINLLVKHAARGLGKYLTIFGSYLDAASAEIIAALLINLQHALAHTENYIKTKSDADKALIALYIGNIAQEIAQLIDVEASGKPYLEILQQINRTIPLMIEELRQGIADNPIKPVICPIIENQHVTACITPEALNLVNTLCTFGQNEWLDIVDEAFDGTTSDSESLVLFLELLPTVAYQIGSYLTDEQGTMLIQLLQDLHNISIQAELCIANASPLAKQLMFANCGKLIQDTCMHFKLPTFPVAVLSILKACNLELPIIVKQFNNGVARAKR